uniref:2-carboxy-D-arabinitol-1-phosphatase n=1 Tax=Nelumbo nucifera TaxID=4432 RepID=A0A822YPZ3_NELNU|nr:TPA_asm: hypothetical protein HUJ06_010169 [Nelumbo nucifera]
MPFKSMYCDIMFKMRVIFWGLTCLSFSVIYHRMHLSEFAHLHPGWLNGFEDRIMSELWDQSEKAWNSLLDELSEEEEQQQNVVVVGHPAVQIALIGHCLNLTKEWMGSISVIDFPDGPTGRGVIRCINYTAHLGRWSIPVTRPTVDDEEF